MDGDLSTLVGRRIGPQETSERRAQECWALARRVIDCKVLGREAHALEAAERLAQLTELSDSEKVGPLAHLTFVKCSVVIACVDLGRRLFLASAGRVDMLEDGYQAVEDVCALAQIREQWDTVGRSGPARSYVEFAEEVAELDTLALVTLARVWSGSWGLPS